MPVAIIAVYTPLVMIFLKHLQEVQDVAGALWTPELIEDYKESIDPTPVEPITEEEVATTDEVATDTEETADTEAV